MKQWTDITPRYEDIIEPLLLAVPWAIAHDAGVPVVAFDYDGYDTPATAHICTPPDEALTLESIEHSDQNALETVLNIVFRLGYEQGVKETKKNDEVYELMERMLDEIKQRENEQ